MSRDLMKLSQQRIADAIMNIPGGSTAKKYFDFASSPEQGLQNIHDKAVEAQILTNFQRVMDSDLAQQMIMTNDYGPYVMEVWPVVTAWYPEFPLKDLISVQDMDKPLAYLFFSKLYAGTTKSPTNVGDVLETPLGTRQIKGSYPTGEIVGEQIPYNQLDNTHKQALLAYSAINTNADYMEKILIVVGNDRYTATGINDGVIALSTGGDTPKTATLEQKSGLITFGTVVPENTTVVANYVWNIEYANEQTIPTVKEDIEMVPMEAKPRAIAMKWTIFSEYLKKSQFGIDIRQENTKRILDLIYQFQLRYILDAMYDYAAVPATPVTLTIPSATTMSVEVKSQVVQQNLKQIANTIEINSGRMEGNRIVCGKNFKSFVESLPNNLFQPTAQPAGFSGPREIGKYGTFTVYYDQMRGADEAFMTYRGSEWYDAAYYLGVFMPIVPTDAIALGVTVRESFCSMEAHKYHKPTCVIPFTVTYA